MFIVSIFALLISVGALYLSVKQQNQVFELEKQVNLDPGQLIIHSPTEFCIMRGFYPFPSDHILLPINFENTGKGAKTIERPALFFNDLNGSGQRRFIMKGYGTSLSNTRIDESYEIGGAVTIPEKSFQRYILIFQPDHWWDRSSDDFSYQFRNMDGGKNILDLQFVYFNAGSGEPVYWKDAQQKTLFLSMPIFKTVNNFSLPVRIRDYLRQDPEYNKFSAFLEKQQVGTYTSDCFAAKDFPSIPS